MARPLAALPKAHLHLHFTGSMRHATLVELAARHGVRLPEALSAGWPPRLSAADERGWFRFQRLYDIARSVIRTEADLRRLVRETSADERADGSGWLEIQVDPSGYAAHFGGITAVTEIILDAAAESAASSGVGIGVIIAANRTKHPLEARTLVAARAGLLAVPHGGELAGPSSVRACLDELNADRIGHGVAAAEDQDLAVRIAARQTTLEVCPASNVALGIAAEPADVPLRTLLEAGIQVALGADDPLLFGHRLTAQYELARQAHGLADEALAELARMSVRGSAAPPPVRARLLAGIDAWLAAPEPDCPPQSPAGRSGTEQLPGMEPGARYGTRQGR